MARRSRSFWSSASRCSASRVRSCFRRVDPSFFCGGGEDESSEEVAVLGGGGGACGFVGAGFSPNPFPDA